MRNRAQRALTNRHESAHTRTPQRVLCAATPNGPCPAITMAIDSGFRTASFAVLCIAFGGHCPWPLMVWALGQSAWVALLHIDPPRAHYLDEFSGLTAGLLAYVLFGMMLRLLSRPGLFAFAGKSVGRAPDIGPKFTCNSIESESACGIGPDMSSVTCNGPSIKMESDLEAKLDIEPIEPKPDTQDEIKAEMEAELDIKDDIKTNCVKCEVEESRISPITREEVRAYIDANQPTLEQLVNQFKIRAKVLHQKRIVIEAATQQVHVSRGRISLTSV